MYNDALSHCTANKRRADLNVKCAGTNTATDMSLEYLSPQDLGLEASHVPQGWPQTKPHRYPFNGGLTDYCRLVGPGVLVGLGFKAPQMGLVVGNEFLYFILVKC